MHLSVGITGHRDLLESEKPGLEDQVRAFFQMLRNRYPRLELQLLSPLAEGGDQLAAKVAIEQGVQLIAVLPMPRDQYEKDFKSDHSLAEFRRLFTASQQVIELPAPSWDKDHVFDQKVATRDRQYAQVGVFVSNHCQVLLALWDGKPGDAVGGTAQVMRYHLTAVMEGFEDQLSSANLLADNENDLAFHIVCSRDRDDGQPAPGMLPLENYWVTSQHGRGDGADLPFEYDEMFERLEEFQSDTERLDAEEKARYSLLSDLPDQLDVPHSVRFTERLFGIADALAIHYQKRVTRGLYAVYSLAVLMGLVFVVYSEYDVSPVFLWLFLALFFVGIGLHYTGDRHQWHRKYLDYRALAEALRVQFCWNLSGVVESRSVGFAYENFLQKQDVELGWIRHVMRAASMQRARGIEPDPAWLPWVIEQWVGDQGSGQGQLNYYSRKEAENSTQFRRTEFLGKACLWSGVGVALVLAVATPLLTDSQQQFLLILMGLLPFIAGIRDAISHKRAEKELIKQYRFMAHIFANARRLLDANPSLSFQRRVLKALGEAALEEGAEWILMHRARPLEHQGLG